MLSGASRGLGAALARAAVAAGDRAIGIARGDSSAGETLRWDLSRPAGLAAAVAERLEQARRAEAPPSAWVLVNNAGLLGPIGERYGEDEVQAVLQVNLASAILLSRAFVDALSDVSAPKQVINISSGAATRTIAGWSLYSASKAGLEHYGRGLAAEQATAEHPVDVVNLSPGVIDTDMQAEIRAAGPKGFPDHDRFVGLQAEGALASPDAVAAAILRGASSRCRHAGATLTLAEYAGR
nr:SDR family NAD(P)-dependent oxidoreductase [Lysobacter sp. CAU 1642]